MLAEAGRAWHPDGETSRIQLVTRSATNDFASRSPGREARSVATAVEEKAGDGDQTSDHRTKFFIVQEPDPKRRSE
jgi:hypothetical protein